MQEPIINDSLILVRFDFVLALESLLVDLGLLGSNEGSLVDIRVDFDVRVVAQLESILVLSASSPSAWSHSYAGRTDLELAVLTYPLAIVDRHVLQR